MRNTSANYQHLFLSPAQRGTQTPQKFRIQTAPRVDAQQLATVLSNLSRQESADLQREIDRVSRQRSLNAGGGPQGVAIARDNRRISSMARPPQDTYNVQEQRRADEIRMAERRRKLEDIPIHDENFAVDYEPLSEEDSSEMEQGIPSQSHYSYGDYNHQNYTLESGIPAQTGISIQKTVQTLDDKRAINANSIKEMKDQLLSFGANRTGINEAGLYTKEQATEIRVILAGAGIDNARDWEQHYSFQEVIQMLDRLISPPRLEDKTLKSILKGMTLRVDPSHTQWARDFGKKLISKCSSKGYPNLDEVESEVLNQSKNTGRKHFFLSTRSRVKDRQRGSSTKPFLPLVRNQQTCLSF